VFKTGNLLSKNRRFIILIQKNYKTN